MESMKKQMLQGKRYINLQISDQDVVGGRFNGFDLHFKLNDLDYRSFDIVAYKQSDDPDTIVYARDRHANFAKQILYGKEFILSDIVHLHLIHNTDFDLSYLPLMSSLKPMILTLHDPFFMGGHCTYHLDCEKWKTHCMDCPYLQIPFAIQQDTTAVSFALKKRVFEQSQISLLVASEWMRDKVRQSPILQNKKTYLLPFGVNQAIFRPAGKEEAREALGLPKDRFTVLLRAEGAYKGTDIARDALIKLRHKEPITVLVVSLPGIQLDGLLGGLPKHCIVVEQGWVTDERRLAMLYQACDVMLMPSRLEAFGVMAIEAMSCGRTVLAIHGTALPRVIQSPECGLAVDEKAYADALQMLYDHPETLQMHAERSHAYAKEHYSEAHYIDGMLAVYQEVMAHHQPGEDAAVVLRQLLTNGPYTKPPALSASWRVTKPLRAAKAALRAFQNSMRNSDRVQHTEILHSASWKLTRPLRAMNGIRKRLKRKGGAQ